MIQEHGAVQGCLGTFFVFGSKIVISPTFELVRNDTRHHCCCHQGVTMHMEIGEYKAVVTTSYSH
jgi:hypothetical protein